MASVLEKYLQEIRQATSRPGIYAYRGQARAEWPLRSAATRRLIESLGDDAWNNPHFSNIYIDYHRDTLVEAARTRGFGVETGHRVTDLQLLAKLQHFNAATGLLDFTWSPLTALWFACSESDFDGKLFVLNANDTIQVAKVPNDPELQTIEAVFTRADNAPRMLYWEPMWSGDAMPRILRQRGVFVIGRPLVPKDSHIIQEIEISKDDKASLIEELALLDISQAFLFPDIYGFSGSEGVASTVRVKNPKFYFVQGNQHYQVGNYGHAIATYDRCIDLVPNVGEFYFLRGNAKSASTLFREAVQDYEQAIAHRDQVLFGIETAEDNPVRSLMLFMAYFNCGNAMAELCEYDAALSYYGKAVQLKAAISLDKEVAFFNRGNVYLDLGQSGEAINDYDKALSLRADEKNSGRTFFNKGNTLVMIGLFNEALECYRLAEQHEVTAHGPSQNRRTLEDLISAIGTNGHQCRFIKCHDGSVDRLEIQTTRAHSQSKIPVFQGRVGNTGNFGWNMGGGKGFGGKNGFMVMLVTEQGFD